MASRRDELNAYTFAKRRTLASFLQPSPSGSEEGAPKPLRALWPGAVVGVVILAVFGGIGVFSPKAPKDWAKAEEHVIVASDSTTRYVVLKTDGREQLHPVLNMASAKLLLDPDKTDIITVDEEILDSGKPPHGATIGIPYAPDRLPSPDEAEVPKRWAVCERPGEGGRAIQKAAFVLAEKEFDKTGGSEKLSGGDLMYVVGPDGRTQYVVDARGTAYQLADPTDAELLKALDTQGRDPQRVSQKWLDTLHKGDPISIPEIDGTPGAKANASTGLEQYDKVGEVIKAYDGRRMQYYVVLQGEVARISEFVATLLLNSGDLVDVGQAGEAQQVHPSVVADSTTFEADKTWPAVRAEDGERRLQRHLGPQHRLQRPALGRLEGEDEAVHLGGHRLPRSTADRFLQRVRHPGLRPALPPVQGRGDEGRRRLPGHGHGPALRPAVQQRQHHRRRGHRHLGQAARGRAERGEDRPDPARLRKGDTLSRPGAVVDVPADGAASVGGGGAAAAGFVDARWRGAKRCRRRTRGR